MSEDCGLITWLWERAILREVRTTLSQYESTCHSNRSQQNIPEKLLSLASNKEEAQQLVGLFKWRQHVPSILWQPPSKRAPSQQEALKAIEQAMAQALALGPDGHGRTPRNTDAVLATSHLLLLAEKAQFQPALCVLSPPGGVGAHRCCEGPTTILTVGIVMLCFPACGGIFTWDWKLDLPARQIA